MPEAQIKQCPLTPSLTKAITVLKKEGGVRPGMIMITDSMGFFVDDFPFFSVVSF